MSHPCGLGWSSRRTTRPCTSRSRSWPRGAFRHLSFGHALTAAAIRPPAQWARRILDMRSSSTQIANQSVCVGGEYWDVWASGSNSQPASQMKPDRKGIGPCKRDSIPGDSIPTTRTGHAIRYLASIRWRNGTALYIAILVVKYRTHGPSSPCLCRRCGRCRACSWWVMAPCTSLL